MLRAQQVYAPAPPALWSAGDIALGRRLFSTLPEDRFDRGPVTGGGGRWTLIGDLRLDNRPELCEALAIEPARAALLSDAAVAMAAFERWEDEAISRLLGDFALALWDRDRARLLLARDFIGQRPLHYHRGAGFFAFASMAKGLHVLPQVPPAPRLRDGRRLRGPDARKRAGDLLRGRREGAGRPYRHRHPRRPALAALVAPGGAQPGAEEQRRLCAGPARAFRPGRRRLPARLGGRCRHPSQRRPRQQHRHGDGGAAARSERRASDRVHRRAAAGLSRASGRWRRFPTRARTPRAWRRCIPISSMSSSPTAARRSPASTGISSCTSAPSSICAMPCGPTGSRISPASGSWASC